MQPRSPRQLFDRYHLQVFNYFRRMLGGDRQMAEDLTQEVFLRITRSRENYRERQREAAWLFTIARNVLRDQKRTTARRPALTSLDSAGPVSIDATQHLTRCVREALQRLDESQREAFLLRELSGLGYREIATLIGTTPDAVRSRIHRARSSLRRWLSAPLGRERAASFKEAQS